VTLSHDKKLDDPAIALALRSPVAYIGALGSRKTQAARNERLRAEFSDEDLERIHGPVGLAIGARSPEEVALAIVAEVVQTLRQPLRLTPRAAAPR
jgi:xanthine dehydrogenase accessory factor